MRRTNRLRGLVVLAVAGLTFLALAPPAVGADATGTVTVEVRYRDAAGDRHPLPGVAVYLWDYTWSYEVWAPDWRMECTDAEGAVTFDAVTTTMLHYAYSGPGPCANGWFLNPEDNRKMWSVFKGGVHGVFEWTPFEVGPSETVTFTLRTRTPAKQWKVCDGLLTTIRGSNGDDDIYGTNGPDVINARAGNDVVHARGGVDTVCGGTGNDRLYGGDYGDRLFGEQGRDRLFGGAWVDYAHGGPGYDRCKGVELVPNYDAVNDPGWFEHACEEGNPDLPPG